MKGKRRTTRSKGKRSQSKKKISKVKTTKRNVTRMTNNPEGDYDDYYETD